MIRTAAVVMILVTKMILYDIAFTPKIFVKLRTCKSNWKEIEAGIPQGTKVGPLFFLIVVNDLSSELPLNKYIDDCSVSEVVRISELDASKLQQEIDNVTQWSGANNMKLIQRQTEL